MNLFLPCSLCCPLLSEGPHLPLPLRRPATQAKLRETVRRSDVVGQIHIFRMRWDKIKAVYVGWCEGTKETNGRRTESSKWLEKSSNVGAGTVRDRKSRKNTSSLPHTLGVYLTGCVVFGPAADCAIVAASSPAATVPSSFRSGAFFVDCILICGGLEFDGRLLVDCNSWRKKQVKQKKKLLMILKGAL